MARASLPRRIFGLLARLTLTGLMFAYLFTRIDLSELAESFARLPTAAVFTSLLAFVAGFLASVVRWRVLLHAYGARSLPRYGELARLYLVALFYNLLPGAVGGDVVRGYASRAYFDDRSASRAIGVVFVERVLGFGGLLLLAALVAAAHPIDDVAVVAYACLGLALAGAAVAGLALGRRSARFLPGPLARVAASLPVLHHPGAFLLALLLAVFTHVLVSLTGHALIRSLDPRVALVDSLVIFPVGTLAAYFPLTIAGAGTRDAALVALFAKRGVARTDALACSLCLLAMGIALALLGGLLQGPKREDAAPAGDDARSKAP